MIETRRAPKKAAPNVSTSKPLIMLPKYQKSRPFMTRENKPKVTIFSGKVRIFITGLINILNKVRHAPTISTTHNGLTFIPEMILVDTSTATDIIIQCKIIFIVLN
jgi:hypothetical protein